MKKLESSLTNMVIVLVLVAVITGGLLAWVNGMTSGPIQIQKELAEANSIKKVMCVDDLTVASKDTIKQTDKKGKEKTFVMFNVADKNNQPLGTAVKSAEGGFSGDIVILVGFDATGKLLGYDVLEHAETPGLGAKANVWFQAGSKGDIIGRKMDKDKPLKVKKDNGDIEAITASTITSRAFLDAVNNAYAVYAAKNVKAAPVKAENVEVEAANNEPQKN